MPRHHLKRWRAMLPAHAEVATPDIGHCPYLDTPGALVAELRAFGARHAGST
jgi:pimeloyl-ACP methyl ester carboxylesterase